MYRSLKNVIFLYYFIEKSPTSWCATRKNKHIYELSQDIILNIIHRSALLATVIN